MIRQLGIFTKYLVNLYLLKVEWFIKFLFHESFQFREHFNTRYHPHLLVSRFGKLTYMVRLI